MYKRKLIVLISLIGIGIGTYFIFNFYNIFFWNNTVFKNKHSYVFIDHDDTMDSLEIQLEPLLKSSKNFLIAAEKKGYSQNIKPGKYKLIRGSGNNDLINVLRSKRLTVKVVFNNQERIENLAKRVSSQIAADSSSLMNAFYDTSFLESNGFSKENILAMYLPNSYDFFWDTTAEGFRKKMFNNYQQFWNKDRLNKAKAKNLSPIDVYILASIVQKESPKEDEQPRVASVYLNRLAKRMKLQADPTVIYALKKESNDFDQVIKRVLLKDLKISSLFNTYKNKGLPPGPITMPDISTIEVVLSAEQNTYLYFVADPSKPGYHLFAKNLRQHNSNKQLYINWINKKKIYR